MDGIEVCRRLRATGDVGILMLTARGEDQDQVPGLESGADDYLVKPFTLPVLLARMRAILRRQGHQPAKHLAGGRRGAGPPDAQGHARRAAGRTDPARIRSAGVAAGPPAPGLFARSHRQPGLGLRLFGRHNVVDVYIRYLREKLGDDERSLIRSVRGVGYTLEPPDELR